MKKNVISVLCLIVILSIASVSFGLDNGVFEGFNIIKVDVNGETVTGDVPAINLNGRTVVPASFVSEALGAIVEWDGETSTVNIKQEGVASDSSDISPEVNSNTGEFEGFKIVNVKVNGKLMVGDVPAVNLNGRTMVPVRFVSEALGAKVEWDGTTSTVRITQESQSKDVVVAEIKEEIVTDGISALTVFGKEEFDDFEYMGDIKNGKANGKGVATYSDGDKYEGEFKDNLLEGQGTYAFIDGSKYIGEFKNGLFEGQGTKIFASGNTYVGVFINGTENGQGTFAWVDGTKYIGDFKDNLFEGKGTYTFTDGSKYIGDFKNDLFEGQGTFTFADGNTYVGDFKNDLFEGQGTLTYADGNTYVGEFKGGIEDGQGTIFDSNGTKDVGEFIDGEFKSDSDD